MPKRMRSSQRWTNKDLTQAKKQVPGRMTAEAFRQAQDSATNPLETDIQQDFFEQIEAIPFRGGNLKDYVFAIPNGGHRSKRTGAILKREGVKRGVPDTHCFVAIEPYHGLYIEFKRETGDLSPYQVHMIRLLRLEKYKVVVCRSARSGVTELLKYLGIGL